MDTDNFDRLVSNMSLEERQSLLKKMKTEFTVSSEFLYIQDDLSASEKDAPQAEYARLPWYSRFWYYILSLFKSVPAEKIYADDLVSVLGNKINEKAPGIYDYQSGLLLSAFLGQMEKLRESARFFYSALDTSVNRDRGAFFAFLGSLEIMEVHQLLHEQTNPQIMAGLHQNVDDVELKQIAIKSMEGALKMLTDEQRIIMYQNARSLFCLRELSTFLYDRVIMSFSKNSAVNEEACPVNTIRELLISLSNILFSLKTVPPMPLMESLFIFSLQDKAEENGFDINKEMRLIMDKAEGALSIIREFNNQVPLIQILRCATRNMSLMASEISGGEDWFMFYRDYWKKRLDSLFSEYSKDKRQQHFNDIFSHFFKGKEVKTLKFTQSHSNPEGLPIKGALALSFLGTFYSEIFVPEIDMVLRYILDDDAFRFFSRLGEEILEFEQRISPTGDYGKRYNQVQQEMVAMSVKRRKTQIVLEEACEDAQRIIEGAMAAAKSIVEKLNAISGKDISHVQEAILHFHGLITILKDIEDNESEH